jgi:hypothetical protein
MAHQVKQLHSMGSYIETLDCIDECLSSSTTPHVLARAYILRVSTLMAMGDHAGATEALEFARATWPQLCQSECRSLTDQLKQTKINKPAATVLIRRSKRLSSR